MKKERGRVGGPKRASSRASVRVVTFLFLREMDLLHSRVTVGGTAPNWDGGQCPPPRQVSMLMPQTCDACAPAAAS